jgi:hypothetical protein
MAEDLVSYSRRLEELWGCCPLLRVNGKAPIDRSWSTGPTRQPRAWRAKLEGWTGNVGLLCGELGDGSHLVVVDVDLYHDGAEDVLDDLYGLGLPKDTVTVLTGGGGQHLYYRSPVPIASRPYADGIDVKSDGGQVVFPYSVHPETGRSYEFEFGYGPEEKELAELPAALIEVFGESVDRRERTLDERDTEALELLTTHFGGHHPLTKTTHIEVTRPGKERGASATVGYVGPGVVKVWSSNWPQLPAGVYDRRRLRHLAGVPTSPPFEINVARDWTPPSLVFADTLRPRRPRWLWQDLVPTEELVLAVGAEKLGKSTACMWIAARTTKGELPGDRQDEPGTVAVISGEDAADRVLLPRAIAAGADLKRLAFLRHDGPGFSIDDVIDIEPVLVVLDPLSLFIHLTSTNEHAEIAVRQSLAPFVALAQKGVTVIGVRHRRKGAAGDNPFDVIMGSRAWGAAARSVLFFAADRERKEGGGFVFAKGNLAPSGAGRRYRLDPVNVAYDDGEGSVPLFVLDDRPVGISLDEALGSLEEQGAVTAAEGFLAEILGPGPMPVTEIQRFAEIEGHAWRTVQRAKSQLGIRSEREGWGRGSVVSWSLPDNYGASP